MGLVVLAVLIFTGSWIWGWLAKPQVAEVPPAQQDAVVSRFRRVGFEIGRNAQGQIQVITTPNPLLVTDKDLALLTGLAHLVVLDLRGTQITDEALLHLRDLPQLKELYLGGSVVTDVEPPLFHARITDAAIQQITQLSSLEVLSLAKTDITDQGVQQLPRLSNLKVLYLLGTPISDDAVASLAEMKSLESLYLQETRISPEGLARLRKELPQTEILPLAYEEP